MNLKRKANHAYYNLGRLCKLVHLSNSHANLAPEASNNPIEIRVLNWGLILILHYSSDNQIIKMIPEIKFAIMNLLICSSEERLSSIDCNTTFKADRICFSVAFINMQTLMSFPILTSHTLHYFQNFILGTNASNFDYQIMTNSVRKKRVLMIVL